MFSHKIETPRLYLRNWQEKDILEFAQFAADPDVMLSSGTKPAKSPQELEKNFEKAMGDADCFAIVLKETKLAIGQIKYQPDHRRFRVNSISIGYELTRAYWGNGYMPEALRAMVRHAFEKRHVDVVAIGHFTENHKSKRVIEKCHFQHEGTIPQAFKRFDGKVFDDEAYSILKADYLQNKDFYKA